MNKNKYYLAVAVLGLLITTAGVSAIAGATDNDVSSRLTAYPERAEKFQEHRDEMKQSLNNKDYDAWKSLLADKVSEDKLTEENFNNHLQMHELMLSGDFEGAKALAEELGFPMRKMKSRDKMFNSEIKQALENGDYDTWSELTADQPIAEIITADNFDQLVKLHQLKQAGDIEEAKALAEELGLDELGHGKAYKKGFHDGRAFGEKRCQAEL